MGANKALTLLPRHLDLEVPLTNGWEDVGTNKRRTVATIDLFCGAGGLTHGLELEGVPVVAGIDLDPACRYAYEANNKSRFLERDVGKVKVEELERLFGDASIRILAGCAPCQPFSTYAQRYGVDGSDDRWGLLYHFARLAKGVKPDIITMENVPTVAKHKVFSDFVRTLERLDYKVWSGIVDCTRFGVPQVRKRMVLLASKHGAIEMIEPTAFRQKTVRQTIGRMRPIGAGESASGDRLHVASTLSDVNLRRIKVSRPGGTWRDWPSHLVAKCHQVETGKTYPGVYGRMEWDKPAPTMTTQCFGFGNGRFGHPEQNRAISLREAAMLQSFPKNYAFVSDDDPVYMKSLGRLIGNAVPVELGRAIAKSINIHISRISNFSAVTA